LSKIKNYYIGTSKKGISSDELANGLNLTRRSAQRILKVLLESDLANIIGEEQPYLKGRPVPVYRILI
jgi:predicted transcriptional regulator